MFFRESETVELKLDYTENIRKEIIAFANTNGGTLYVGVSDDGHAAGVPDPDELILRIGNMLRDSVRPDITLFVHYDIEDAEDARIVRVLVNRGANRPYYWAAKGLRPEGVWVRQGTASVPATDAAIRMMIRETDGDSYEAMRSLCQQLTFDYTASVFEKQGLAFGEAQMKTLSLLTADGIFTNLGLLLSDQCPHIIKAAVFSGTDQQDFRDRREFSGSLLRQLDESYAYLDLQNAKRASFDGLYRRDHRDYPEAALREVLLNAVVHRDYSLAAPTLLCVYSDRLEITSVGGLPHGITLEDVMMGLSVCRNPKLANVFYRLQLIEAYGTGLKKILSCYRDSPAQPNIRNTAHAFKVILPKAEMPAAIRGGQPGGAPQDPEEIVQALIRKRGSVSRAEVEQTIGMGPATAFRLLRRMAAKGLLHPVGSGKNTRYAASAPVAAE